jgi:tetratricopeptide (TPR) repeat protein
MPLLFLQSRAAELTADDSKAPKNSKPRTRVKKAPSAESMPAVAAMPPAGTRHLTIGDEWRAMGPFSKMMAALGLFGFLVGIPGWLSSDYWTGKSPASFLVPPAIAEQLNPQQIAQLTDAMVSLRQSGGSAGTTQDQVDQALEAANRGNLKLAEGLLEDVYAKSAGAAAGAQAEQALAARHLAALAIVGDAGKALTLYRQATALDPAAKDSWLGLGDAALAAGTLTEAEDAFRRFLALVPAETNPVDHSAGLDRLGDVLMARGEAAGAEENYQAAIKISGQLSKSNPGDAGLARNLAVGVKKLGDLHAAAGSYDKALAAYQDAIGLMQTLADKDKANAQARLDLSALLNDAGDMEVRMNHAGQALAAYSDGLRLAEALSSRAPDDAKILRALAVSHVKTGEIKAATNSPDEALAAFSKALAIREKLIGIDPANSEWQRDLAVNLIKIGTMKLAAHAADEALNSFAQGLSIMEKIAAQDPANLDLQRDLSVSLGKIGDAQMAAGQPAAAIVSHGKGLVITQALAARQPANAELQRDIIVGHYKLAEDGADPAVHFAKALQQAQAMQAKGILGPIDQWMVDDLKKRVADLPQN